MIYRDLQSFALFLGGEYEILSCILYFFCSLNINTLHSYFCLDCAIFVPILSREKACSNIWILREILLKTLLSYICTSGSVYLLDNATFFQQPINSAMLFRYGILL